MIVKLMFYALLAIAAQDAKSDELSARQVFEYESLSDTLVPVSRIKLDFTSGDLVYPATYVELSRCKARSRPCFQSSRMTFCAPTMDEEKRGAWTCGGEGMKFSLSDRVRIRMMGEDLDALVINGGGVDYYYSRTNGLVMFRFIGAQVAEVYWSTNAIGFGAESQMGK